MIEIETAENGRLIDRAVIKATAEEAAAFAVYLKTKSERIPAGILATMFLLSYRKGLRFNPAMNNWQPAS